MSTSLPRPRQWSAKLYKWLSVFIIFVAGCGTADYRTDYEMGRGITLTAQQKRNRESLRKQNLELWAALVKQQADQDRLMEMVYCETVEIDHIC